MEIAVLGGGNGSHAAAADLSEQGHRVRFWRRDRAGVEDLNAAGNRLTLKDFKGTREIATAVVTADIGEAVSGADLIVCPAPAFAQTDIARAMAPHLSDGQVVFLPPGTFGCYLMAKAIRDAGSAAKVAFAETGTLPYLTRKHGPRDIAITVRATRLPTGVFPLEDKDRALALIREAYPSVEDCGDGLSGALMNAGPVIHPPLIVMNAGPLEHFDHWDIHNEGTQPAVRRVTNRLDAERVAVREALGYEAPHFPLADHYATDGDEWMYGRKGHEQLVDSGDWREHIVLTEHRYMREDVQQGLAFLVSVADWAGVPAPTATGLLAIGSAICDDDFRANGRTLEGLGLAGLDRAGMTRLLREGV
ncbi:NAD/NADP-dependent octopine/nopaline dehydrogenase family protein [Microbaculum marinisediminis]|uniref:NAD/NADP octopine/nopaline dehydrogenase family protein n=1 Tax=Microbaculum marinisediminis TaxID=2931392 RepID=A0AAW5R0R8_9HYPH|nr:NAD/NADP-dependent octopine/nopaline dehydrogenase family protein [Microbaculum sp. A6E488]MCT8973404.1 NAD/NADP octopine/nopaline dehydrogenase family protein [Microbaculum sp. A6E488]